MQKLTEIANRLNIDKGTTCTTGPHGYTETYGELFEPLLHNHIKMMEIGVCDPRFPGGSLKLWKEYFPDLRIVGFDNNPEANKFMDMTISIYIGDQNSQRDLLDCIYIHETEFDIIIDDGSHYGEHILTSFKTLFPYVSPGGYYIIEDLHSVYTHADITIPALDEIMKDLKFDIESKTFYHGHKLLVIKKAL